MIEKITIVFEGDTLGCVARFEPLSGGLAIGQWGGTDDGKTTLVLTRDIPVSEGWRLVKDGTHDERSWPEDFKLENGHYRNVCYGCNRGFSGHRSRHNCRVCTEFPPALNEADKSRSFEAARKIIEGVSAQ